MIVRSAVKGLVGALFLGTVFAAAGEPAGKAEAKVVFSQDFNALAVGPLSADNAAEAVGFKADFPAPEVVSPEEGSALYVGPGDKVLKITARKKLGGDGAEFGNGDYGSGISIAEAVTRKLEPGHTYVLDYSFYAEEASTIPLARLTGDEYTRFWFFANPVGGGEPGRIRGTAGNLWGDFANFKPGVWNRVAVVFTIRDEVAAEVSPKAYLMDGAGYFNDMATPVAKNADYKGCRRPYGPLDIFFTPWKASEDDAKVAQGIGYINNLRIYEADEVCDL